MNGIGSAGMAYGVLVGFIVLWLANGYYWSKKIKKQDDFSVAGRSVGFAVGTGTIIATWITANTILTAPEHGFDKGIWGLLGYAAIGGGVLLFSPLSKRIKDLMPHGVTSGEFFKLRYGKTTWGLYFVLGLAYLYAFLVTQSMGAGLVLYAVFGIPYHIGMIAITLACVAYTMMGGIKSVIAMDFINTILIMATLVIVVPIALTKVGIAEIYSGVMMNMPERLSILSPIGLLFGISAPFLGIGEIFHSNLWWVRAHSIRDDSVRKSWIAGGLIWSFVPIISGITGLMAIATGNIPEQLNMVFPLLSVQILGTGGAFLITVLVLASISSSLDSLLSGTSSLIIEDIYKGFINPNADSETVVRLQRLMILILGLISIGLAWFQVGTMGQILFFSGAFVCAMIWPIVFGLYDKNVSAVAANASMISGTVAGVLTNIYVTSFAGPIVSAVVSLIVFMIARQLYPEDFDWSRLNPDTASGRVQS